MILVQILIALSIITYPIPAARIGGQPISIFLAILELIILIFKGKFVKIKKEYFLCFAALLVGFLLSSIFGAQGEFNISYLINLIAFFIIFMGLSETGTDCALTNGYSHATKGMMEVIVFSGIILCIYGYYGYITGNVGDETSKFWWASAKYWGIHYTQSTRNADVHYIAIPFVAVLAKEKKKMIDWVLLAAFGSALLLSMARNCWIAILIIVLIMIKNSNNAVTGLKIILLSVIGMGIGILLLSYFGMGDFFIEKILSVFNKSSGVSNSNGERWKIILATLETILKNPFGVGAERMSQYYSLYGLTVNHAENTYLNIFAEMGMIATIAFVFLFIRPLALVNKIKKQQGKLSSVEKYVYLSHIYLLITMFFNTETINCYFWIILGINWCLTNICVCRGTEYIW